jgi:hypothetical protein
VRCWGRGSVSLVVVLRGGRVWGLRGAGEGEGGGRGGGGIREEEEEAWRGAGSVVGCCGGACACACVRAALCRVAAAAAAAGGRGQAKHLTCKLSLFCSAGTNNPVTCDPSNISGFLKPFSCWPRPQTLGVAAVQCALSDCRRSRLATWHSAASLRPVCDKSKSF